GCDVVALTLSAEQARFARKRMRAAGLENQVEIRIQDYRDVEGHFDKIASIEMFEAVGEENWPAYFDALKRCLKSGGKAGLQVITIDDSRFDFYRRNPDFIQRYIFPGGMLPSPQAFENAVELANLRVTEQTYFGKSYAETLRRWGAAFHENWPRIERLGFDPRFRRMWDYYLRYCEAGFDEGRIDVGQFTIERA
ncbi:MAG: cyclopropane-fatty-acyl-phospholipid synthase family protein, partial [Rhodospirillaceae bacterium]